MIYDIIGDIHGNADKLIGLLGNIGYSISTSNGKKYYQPPKNHKTIFIGDLIDRGSQQIKTLEIVFAMLDVGVAEAVMGNHEYNALAFATADKKGGYLRSHTKSNVQQHEAFLKEVSYNSEEHHYWLNRLYELPLWIEKPDVCFVHACWDKISMDILQPHLTDNNCMTEHGLYATSQKNTLEYQALESILKGIEVKLPNGFSILDRYGTNRDHIRIKWWLKNLNDLSIQEIARVPQSDMKQLSELPENMKIEKINFQVMTNNPIFIGHYWMSGIPEPLSDQVVCTDYSAAVDTGLLTCYRFDTDSPFSLSKYNFFQFNHHME